MTKEPVQRYARIAGCLLLITIVAGGFGEIYVPSNLIVSADATATATNIVASESLFRLGFASYLLEALCDITLSLIFYVLLRPVSKNLALLAAFFGLVSTATFAIGKLFYFFGASLILGGADQTNMLLPDQLNNVALLAILLYGTGAEIFFVFYGVASIIRGYLIYKSGYIPRLLGALLMLGGIGFVTTNFATVLAPTYAFEWLRLPMGIALLSLSLWLLVKGIDVLKWEKLRTTSG